MASSRGNHIQWDTAELRTSIAAIEPRIHAGLAVTGSKIAAEGESWMKANAPWNDITGNARNGLRGRYGAGAGRNAAGQFTGGGTGGGGSVSHKVTFSHSVEYGIWLEIRFDGRNAIILPAVEQFATRWASLLNRLLIGS